MRTSLRDGPYPPAGPTADCTADSAGGLTFDVELPGEGERWDVALLLRRAGGTDEDGAVRLPLFPSGEGRLRAALPSTMTLAEGRWDGYLVLGEGDARRLRSGRHDLRSLVDREPSVHRTWLGVRIPYATRQSGLALRSWLRWPHAEARYLHLGDGGLALGGRLYGAELGPSARLEARWRADDPAGRTAAGPGAAPGTVSVAVTGRGADFRCTLPYAALTGPGEWDLWLRPGPGAPVRVARILDDVADKDRVLRYPPQRLDDGTGRTVTPYWTGSNDLALRLGGPGPVGRDTVTNPRHGRERVAGRDPE